MQKSTKPKSPGDQLVHSLTFFNIDAVIDIGANRGQYGQRLRRNGYRGPIYSFEPLPEIHQQLRVAANDDPDWHIPPRTALGAKDGSSKIAVSAESDMSSILPQTDLHKQISPTSKISRITEVPIARLDRLLTELDVRAARIFAKIDVQGFEQQVLEGMSGLWHRVQGVQLEMALVKLYEGEWSWQQAIDAMERQGFELMMLMPGYYERKLGRQLQVDGVFFRRAGQASFGDDHGEG